MAVTLNQAAIARLLETEEGPVGRFVARTAERVVLEAQKNVRDYFATAPTLNVNQDIGFTMQGSSATIGIAPDPTTTGHKAQRMADAQANGSFPWLTRALEASRV